MKTVVITNRPEPSQQAQIEAVSSLMDELMARARAGDIEIGLNALIGAYVNVALQAGRAAKAGIALEHAAEAVRRIHAGTAHRQPFEGDVQAVVDRFTQQLAGVGHDVALSALFSIFRAIALRNPCCADSCADRCVQTAEELRVVAASATRPAGSQVH